MLQLSPTLSVMKTAGVALDVAGTELQKSVQELADQLNIALLNNPFDLGNDTLFEIWKATACLARQVAQIQTEFKGLGGTTVKADIIGMAPKAKRINHSRRDAVQKPSRTRPSSAPNDNVHRPLAANPAKVLARLQKILNTQEFVKINRSAEAKEVGLPQGSMGAALVKLIQTGHLIENPSGLYKLTAA